MTTRPDFHHARPTANPQEPQVNPTTETTKAATLRILATVPDELLMPRADKSERRRPARLIAWLQERGHRPPLAAILTERARRQGQRDPMTPDPRPPTRGRTREQERPMSNNDDLKHLRDLARHLMGTAHDAPTQAPRATQTPAGAADAPAGTETELTPEQAFLRGIFTNQN